MLTWKHCWSTAWLLTTLPHIALAQDAVSVIAAASKAMGADSLATIEYS